MIARISPPTDRTIGLIRYTTDVVFGETSDAYSHPNSGMADRPTASVFFGASANIAMGLSHAVEMPRTRVTSVGLRRRHRVVILPPAADVRARGCHHVAGIQRSIRAQRGCLLAARRGRPRKNFATVRSAVRDQQKRSQRCISRPHGVELLLGAGPAS